MTTTTIQWTQRVWNPTTGCDRVSPGCDECYALTLAKRLKGMGVAKYQNDGDPRTSGAGFGVTVHPDTLDTPLTWKKPQRVFVNSMSDLFHARIPVEFISRVWSTMAKTPQHIFQILTKRPERIARVLATVHDSNGLDEPLENVWIGTSIESADYTRRVDHLRAVPAAVRFVSAEPLLGPLPGLDLSGISWLIAGGESGPGARPMDTAWVQALLAQCRTSGTAPFVKQLGAVWAREHGGDRKGGDWDYWPADLRVREFPPGREQARGTTARPHRGRP